MELGAGSQDIPPREGAPPLTGVATAQAFEFLKGSLQGAVWDHVWSQAHGTPGANTVTRGSSGPHGPLGFFLVRFAGRFAGDHRTDWLVIDRFVSLYSSKWIVYMTADLFWRFLESRNCKIQR